MIYRDKFLMEYEMHKMLISNEISNPNLELFYFYN